MKYLTLLLLPFSAIADCTPQTLEARQQFFHECFVASEIQGVAPDVATDNCYRAAEFVYCNADTNGSSREGWL